MECTPCSCPSSQWPLYGQSAPRAQVKRHDGQRPGPRFRCERCAGLGSATTGTAEAGIRTARPTYLRGATALAAGLSRRAPGRLLGVDKDPTTHWLPVLGQPCHGVMNYCFRTLSRHACHWEE
jgi:transposase-like protein